MLQVRKHPKCLLGLLFQAVTIFQQQAANESAIEEDLGLIGASAEDTEAELIRKICETELLAGKWRRKTKTPNFCCPTLLCIKKTCYTHYIQIFTQIFISYITWTSSPHVLAVFIEENLLCPFLPLLVRVCSSPGRYPHPQLTTAACLALSQYMMIR